MAPLDDYERLAMADGAEVRFHEKTVLGLGVPSGHAKVLVDWALKNTFVRLLAYWVQDSDSSHTYIDVFKTFR